MSGQRTLQILADEIRQLEELTPESLAEAVQKAALTTGDWEYEEYMGEEM